jgi:translation initiation factor IF-2
MLVHRGTLKVGDAGVAGDAWGRVRALYDYRGEKIDSAGPGDPVEILGFDTPAPAGELARVVENERRARALAQQRGERLRRSRSRETASRGVSLETLEQLSRRVADQHRPEGRRAGLGRAIVGSCRKSSTRSPRQRHPHGVCGITDNDVNLSAASNAMVIGFNVRPSTEARVLAERQGIEIRQYRVIYELTHQIEQALVGMLSPVETEAVIGEAEVRALFRVSRLDDCRLHGLTVSSGAARADLPRGRGSMRRRSLS